MRIDQRYTLPAIWLHWIVAALMVFNIVLGLTADAFPDDWVRTVIDTHKSVGISVLGLAILRVGLASEPQTAADTDKIRIVRAHRRAGGAPLALCRDFRAAADRLGA